MASCTSKMSLPSKSRISVQIIEFFSKFFNFIFTLTLDLIVCTEPSKRNWTPYSEFKSEYLKFFSTK